MIRRWIGYLVVALAILFNAPARADGDERFDDLSRLLATSPNEKTRIAAAAALGRLGDRRAMKPLVAALADANPQIRVVAAAALGKLAHKGALPALKACGTDDVDEDVRTSAREAALAVAKANGLPEPFPNPAGTARGARRVRAGFGNHPRALEPQPVLYLAVNSANDDSPGRSDKKMRQAHAAIVKQVLVDQCKSHPQITTASTDAQRLGLDLRHIDISVTKLEAAAMGSMIEVEAQLRLAISDDTGKMLSFLSGGAKVQVLRSKFDARYLPNMRREALETAMRGMFDKLVAHLRDRAQT